MTKSTTTNSAGVPRLYSPILNWNVTEEGNIFPWKNCPPSKLSSEYYKKGRLKQPLMLPNIWLMHHIFTERRKYRANTNIISPNCKPSDDKVCVILGNTR
jgi:hypothetical protein